MIQTELLLLNEKFKTREIDSAKIDQITDGAYLCIRMDGFNMTKQFLKDKPINTQFNEALSKANKSVFNSLKHHLNKEFTSGIVCSFIANDEISVILSRDVSNFKRRVIKICTLFTGMMSSAFTQEMRTLVNQTGIMAFDARPILLYSPQEIAEYVRYRFLVGKRYAHWKTLRLDRYENVYDPSIKNNIDNAMRVTEEQGISETAREIIATYNLSVPEEKLKPSILSYNTNDDNMELESLNNRINNYLKYLHSVHRLNYS